MVFQPDWQRELSRRWVTLQQRRALAQDRAGPRRSALVMLGAAGLLALSAVYLARTLNAPGKARGAVPTVSVVVAAGEIGFGQQLTPDRLKLADWPAAALPAGSFASIDRLTTGAPRAALRPIAAGEIILASALAGGTARLAAAPLLAPDRRALAVPVSEVSGVSGFVYPGDRVDVFYTRQGEEAQAYAEVIAQNVQVLAVGTDMNVGKDKPEIVKATTLEVTPLQAQKLSLAMATGQLSLALRRFGDTDRVRLETLQVTALNDGTTTRLLALPRQRQAPATVAPGPAVPGPAVPRPAVIVMRGMDRSVQPVGSPGN